MRQRPCGSGVESGRTKLRLSRACMAGAPRCSSRDTRGQSWPAWRRGGEARALRRTRRSLCPAPSTPLPMPAPDAAHNPQVNSRLGSLKHETVSSHAALLARVEKLEAELLRAKAKS